MAAPSQAALAAPGVRQVVADYFTLTKPKVQLLLLLTTITTMYVAGDPSPGLVAVAVVGGFLSAGGAGAFNHYYDRDLDARMARTAGRPLPAGRIGNPRVVAWLGVGLIAASQISAPVLGVGPALYLLGGAFTYAVVYTAWLKRRTPYSIVIGGAAGSFAALAGWQLAASTWDPAPQLLDSGALEHDQLTMTVFVTVPVCPALSVTVRVTL